MIRWNFSKKVALDKEEKEVWVNAILELRLDILERAKWFVTPSIKILVEGIEE